MGSPCSASAGRFDDRVHIKYWLGTRTFLIVCFPNRALDFEYLKQDLLEGYTITESVSICRKSRPVIHDDMDRV